VFTKKKIKRFSSKKNKKSKCAFKPTGLKNRWFTGFPQFMPVPPVQQHV
jgi:hypothetical protein